MKRVFDNLYVDLIGAALMVVMVATGYILHFPLPAGTNKSLSLWGLTTARMGQDSLLGQSRFAGADCRACLSALAMDCHLGETPSWQNRISLQFTMGKWRTDGSRSHSHIGTLWLGSTSQRQADFGIVRRCVLVIK